MKQRSITPDTHKSRTLIKNEEELIFHLANKEEELEIEEDQINTSSDNLYYLDQYQYNGNKPSNVLHFGINTKSEDFKAQLEENSQKENAESETSSISKITNITKASDIQKIKATLLDCETSLINIATGHLKQLETGRTVLIDILERSFKGGDNKKTRQKEITDELIKPATHTLVLYKSSDDAILVIDPSNSSFSSYLQSLSETIGELRTFKGSLQIYTPKNASSTGYDIGKWRDCIDIAVKLSFILNSSKNHYTTEEYSLKLSEWEEIKQVSNNPVLDAALLTPELPIRTKQASDTKIIKKFNLIENSISKQLQWIEDFNSTKYSGFKGFATGVLASEPDHDKVVKTMLYLEKLCNDSLSEPHVQLMAEIQSLEE
jgi:hypothetical protein